MNLCYSFDQLQAHGNYFILFDEERYFTRPGLSNGKKEGVPSAVA